MAYYLTSALLQHRVVHHLCSTPPPEEQLAVGEWGQVERQVTIRKGTINASMSSRSMGVRVQLQIVGSNGPLQPPTTYFCDGWKPGFLQCSEDSGIGSTDVDALTEHREHHLEHRLGEGRPPRWGFHGRIVKEGAEPTVCLPLLSLPLVFVSLGYSGCQPLTFGFLSSQLQIPGSRLSGVLAPRVPLALQTPRRSEDLAPARLIVRCSIMGAVPVTQPGTIAWGGLHYVPLSSSTPIRWNSQCSNEPSVSMSYPAAWHSTPIRKASLR